jgi:NAD(P)-dependent dehydrogenase (short-subunit alcohol dehydrogenase family)
MSDDNRLSFRGRVAAVTGAGNGLGRAYGRWLAAQGCAVVINNRAHPGVPSSAQGVVDEITAAGGVAVAHDGAIDDRHSAAAMVELAVSQYGKLDVLICNAGVLPQGPFAELDLDEAARLVNINLMGTMYPLQAAWRWMLAQGYGRIVVTGSTVGVYGHAGSAAYGATRAAVIGLARSLTLERPPGTDIAVNVVMPFAYTNMSSHSIDAAMGQGMAEAIRPELIAPIVGWLCSEACDRRGQIFHASSLRTSRIGIVESAPVQVDPQNLATLSQATFALEPLFEPQEASAAVARLLGG